MINQIASDTVLNHAYEWLCKQRQDYSPNNDVWDLRRRWADFKPSLQAKLMAGEYEFSSLDRIHTDKGEVIDLWQSADALVLKAMSIVLGQHLAPMLSPNCYHIKGRGGLKGAVRAAINALEPDSYVMKSDVKSYYASIDHYILYEQVEQFVDDKTVLRLLWGYLKHCVVDGGNYINISRGISLGCLLSPLMGALYLKPLDDAMAALDVTYIRFMDDWLIVVPTRWKLRRVVRTTNQILNAHRTTP
ncbi:MAG: reverse transcriptase domain-containing protein [Pseudomonadota bacterium]